MVYFPDDFRKYFGRLVFGDEWMLAPNALDLMAWGTALTYQARLEPFRFNEVLNRYYQSDGNGGEGRFRKPYAQEGIPLRQWAFRLQLTMQLALEIVTREANIEDRINKYPTQAQLLFDTLYYVAMLHDLEKPRDHLFTISRSDLQSYLRTQAENDRGPALDWDFPGADRATMLFGQLRRYLDLLSNPGIVRDKLVDYAVRQLPDVPEKRLWKRLAAALMPAPIVAIEQSTTPNRIEFRFLIDRSGGGVDETDPLDIARRAISGVNAWEEMLSVLFGSATSGQKIAADAYLLDSTPTWKAIARARRLLAEESGGASQDTAAEDTATDPNDEDVTEHDLRFAAVQIGAFLEMVYAWREALATGLHYGSVAGLAVPSGDAATRRVTGLKALNAVCRLDLLENPEQISDFLSKQLGWPPDVYNAVPYDSNAVVASSSFAESPESLEWYCQSLRTLAVSPQAPPIEWAGLWRTFWSQWDIEASGVRLRAEHHAVANGISVLHAARHGGLPVIPRTRRNLSIGEWWRLAVLAKFSDEDVPPATAKAAAEALEGSSDFSDIFSAFSQRAPTTTPTLFIEVTSSASPAWSWLPERRALAVMPPPENVFRADSNSIRDMSYRDAFERLRQNAIMRERSLLVRMVLRGIFRLRRLLGSVRWPFEKTRLGWLPERVYRAAHRWPLKVRVRRLDFVRCIEIGRNFVLPEIEPADTYVYFGFEPAPRGVTRYIESPTSVVDLLRRIEAQSSASPSAIRLPFGLEWRRGPARQP
jgi:hypothetical protein